MNNIIDRVFERRLFVAACISVFTMLAGWGLSRIEFDDNFRNLFASDSVAFTNYLESIDQFGSDENDVIVLLESDDLWNETALRSLYHLHLRLAELAPVENVISIYSARKAKRIGRYFPALLSPDRLAPEERRQELELLKAHPLVIGQLLNSQGSATLMIVRLAGDELPVSKLQGLRSNIRKIVDQETNRQEVSALLTGMPIIRTDIINQVQRDQARFMAVGILASGLIAWALFQRLSPLLLTAVAPQIGLIWTLGLMGLVGEPLNVINVMVIALILVIGLADSIHLVFHIRDQRDQGVPPLVAAKSAFHKLRFACLLTSITTAIGFGALVLSDDQVIRRFAITAAVGTLVMLVAVLTIVPYLASGYLGTHCKSPSRAKLGNRRGFHWLANASSNFSVPLTVVGTAGLLAALGAATTLENDFRYTENLPEHHEGVRALRRLDHTFGGSAAIHITIQRERGIPLMDKKLHQMLTEIHRVIEGSSCASAPLSLRNLLASLPGGAEGSLREKVANLRYLPKDLRRRFISSDQRSLLVTARVPDWGSKRLNAPLRQLADHMRQVERNFPEYQLTVTGMPELATVRSRSMILNLAWSLGLASILIFGVVALAFRSLRFGLISIVPNALPLAATAACMVALEIPLRYSCVMCFSICLGVAVDDTVHFLSGCKQLQSEGVHTHRAIRKTTIQMSPILCTTTLLMISGFGATLLSASPMVRLFGGLTTLALLVALVGDLLFLPAMLHCCFGHTPQVRDQSLQPNFDRQESTANTLP